MKRKELISKYTEFFKSKNHKEIPNSPLIPENDPTVLFTTAGMHPLVPYLLGQRHPLGKRLVNVQKCIRTTDIDEVGDTTHHTFFEMLGNWSVGDYWKEEAITFTLEFHTKILKIQLEKYAVTCFKGNKNALKDNESAKIWLSLGIPSERIAFLEKDNWWGPAGETGPCGPSTEMFYYTGDGKVPKEFNPENKKWVEIGNDVLMEYTKTKKGFEKAKQQNIDFGGGVERTLAVLNGFEDNYLTEVFKPIIETIEKISKKKYSENKKDMRIIADHIKAAVFILADGITPSNTEQGYVLRRLIRRAVRYGKLISIQNNFTKQVAESVFKIYDDYSHLQKNKKTILEELEKEENRFRQSLASGLKFFKKIAGQSKGKTIQGKEAFLLYQSYGFPIELIKEEAKGKNLKVDEKNFEEEFQKHKELSQTATKGKFKSGLADHSENTTRLHTAAHLLLAALRQILNDKEIIQKGSNINPERLRLDFSFPRKLTDEELEKVEKLVNSKIKASLKVTREEMSPSEAKKQGALGIFDEKYGDVVSVYTMGNFSKEICTGPHVKNTSEIKTFKIQKEESVGAGVRRIKAVVE